jgi:FkbM family methyltransferase
MEFPIEDKRKKTINKGLSFANETKGGVYILGTNKYAVFVKEWLEDNKISVLGFINDFIKQPSYQGVPILSLADVSQNQILINCVVEGRAVEANDKLIRLKPKLIANYFELQLAFPDLLPEVDFLSNTDSILKHLDEYNDLYESLGDDESKHTLSNLLDFRLNRNIDSLRRFQFRINEQYFEPFFSLNEKPIFVDGGGFDGSTSAYFASLYPNYNSIYFFEPNKEVVPLAKKRLMELENVRFYDKGLWSSAKTLKFDNTLNSASKLTPSGEVEISTVSLDEIGLGEVNFIKLDIEGAEFEAIMGAGTIIKEQKPVLAVCVYHAQEDFLRIPALINKYRNDYKVYLRHYTQGVFETVMYFV